MAETPRTTASPVVDPLAELLVAASRGDDAAFAELYDAVSARVYGVVLRVLRDTHQSEEVAQEVFLQVWQTAGRFDPGRGSAISWVLTVAHRRAVDRVRSSDAGRRRDTAHATSNESVPFDETASAAHAAIEATSVRAAMSSLSPIQRQAIELAYFGGHTHTEVSRMLQIPLGTAKSRIRDGLTRLRDALSTGMAEIA